MKLLLAFLLFPFYVIAQTTFADANDIAYKNMRRVTKTIDTTLQYKISDSHGQAISRAAKVKVFFAGQTLVAAERIFEKGYKYENYFYYFNNDQLILIQCTETESGDIIECVSPNYGLLDWDNLANVIIVYFGKMKQN
jgi:hypothetical protein